MEDLRDVPAAVSFLKGLADGGSRLWGQLEDMVFALQDGEVMGQLLDVLTDTPIDMVRFIRRVRARSPDTMHWTANPHKPL